MFRLRVSLPNVSNPQHPAAPNSVLRLVLFGVGEEIHVNGGVKFMLHRCEKPIFMLILVSRNRFFSERRVRVDGGSTGSSIHPDVSYLSCSKYLPNVSN